MVQLFFLPADSLDAAVCCLRLVIFLGVSQELTRSGSSTGSADCFAWAIYQSLTEVFDRRIFTFSLGSMELDVEEEAGEMIGVSFSRHTAVCSVISIDGGTGCFNSRIRFNIALYPRGLTRNRMSSV